MLLLIELEACEKIKCINSKIIIIKKLIILEFSYYIKTSSKFTNITCSNKTFFYKLMLYIKSNKFVA